MTFLELVRHRKSVREFLDKPVERDKIMTCLEAARMAPSASNSQPWSFIVVDDIDLKNKLCLAAFGGLYFINNPANWFLCQATLSANGLKLS